MNLNSFSLKETLRIGKKIAEFARKGDVFCLSGELGAGKTLLAKGIAWGLGINKDAVISPTFVILRQYSGRLPLYHFDLYRLNNPGEILDLGYEEFFFGDGLTIVEWPDRLKWLLPEDCLNIRLSIRGENKRAFSIQAKGKRSKLLLRSLHENLGN
ncbi:MAG: tRNA (adenosine(37)-N6)-threonylcarbamoyltransferase complex ATPase subunit type 1 TsaE [Candidatus Omnitrophota bacterium]|nr:tRNA (adenosine(37)-N6)-threonylcarbamoyltransferase complex ATPase subunit type 1 TsaE [Candidatus Omnitrophota bacterium]